MGIREKLNQKPAFAAAFVGVAIVAAILFVYIQNRTPSVGSPASSSAFFTEDDGQTYFKADFGNLSKDFKGPNGQEALRCYVFRYGNEKPFVGFMEKYTPAGKQILAGFYGNSSNANKPPPQEAMFEVLVKKPGEKTWFGFKDRARFSAIRIVPPKGDQSATEILP